MTSTKLMPHGYDFIKALISSGLNTFIKHEVLLSEEKYLSLAPSLYNIEISNSPESFKKACAFYKARDALAGKISEDSISIVQQYMSLEINTQPEFAIEIDELSGATELIS